MVTVTTMAVGEETSKPAVTTPDNIALQKGALAPAQSEQTGSQKAVTLIELTSDLYFPMGFVGTKGDPKT